jgi:hypothetical protein
MREMVINSTRKLNGGEWHKIWIDYNDYHVRFMINTNVKMVDLLPEEEFGPFEVRSDEKFLGFAINFVKYFREACTSVEDQVNFSRKPTLRQV